MSKSIMGKQEQPWMRGEMSGSLRVREQNEKSQMSAKQLSLGQPGSGGDFFLYYCYISLVMRVWAISSETVPYIAFLITTPH